MRKNLSGAVRVHSAALISLLSYHCLFHSSAEVSAFAETIMFRSFYGSTTHPMGMTCASAPILWDAWRLHVIDLSISVCTYVHE